MTFRLPAILLATAASLHAQDITWSENLLIPDGDPSGLALTRTVGIPMPQPARIGVWLETKGGWNGDLYAWLAHDTGFSILLNRPGRSQSMLDGYPGSGMALSLLDSAAADVHLYELSTPAGSEPSGWWQPDGRTTSPFDVTGTDSRTAMLSSFQGLDPSGDWTLFIADLVPGEQATLVSWGLYFNPVPEPTIMGLLVAAGLVVRSRRTRRRRP